MVESTRESGEKTECETRFYITSLLLLAPAAPGGTIGTGRPQPLGGGKHVHWIMDMVFRDDECRVRTELAPANFTTMKHMAHNLIRRAPGKDSLRLRRKVAGWDDDFLASLIAA